MGIGKTTIVGLVIAALAALPAAAQVDQQQIDAAIKKGADWLTKKYPSEIPESLYAFELIAYTLIHADVDPEKNKALAGAIEKLITREPAAGGAKATYRVAIQALALHSLLVKVNTHSNYAKLYEKKEDAIQERIALCGQFLVDSQCPNGQWTYTGALIHKPEKKGDIATGSGKSKNKPPSSMKSVGAKIAWENASNLTGTIYILQPKSGEAAAPPAATGVNRRTNRGGETGGDNSNTQYGILGLIAAQMSGCVVPEEAWQKTVEWFEKCQQADGGFAYRESGASYGSMTTAGLVAVAACRCYLGDKNFKKNAKVKSGIDWLDKNFKADDNPGSPDRFLYYYLYGLERVGAFLETDKIGGHKWYDEGAAWLVGGQQADGSWPLIGKWDEAHKDDNYAIPTVNTCFAILFLKRATKDIIETGTSGGNPPIIEQK